MFPRPVFGDFAQHEKVREADGRDGKPSRDDMQDSANAGFARFVEAERRKEDAAATTTPEFPFGRLMPAAFNCPGAATPLPFSPSTWLVYQNTGQLITQDGATVNGNYNTVTGNRCTVQGDHNVVVGKNCVVVGNHNTITGGGSSCSGYRNICDGKWKWVCETADGDDPKSS